MLYIQESLTGSGFQYLMYRDKTGRVQCLAIIPQNERLD